MKIIDIAEINGGISSDSAQFIEECDKKYKSRLKKVAESIADNCVEKPIVLLAGPSGSGKTTSAIKLGEMLRKMGIKTSTISMDDYFLPHTAFTEQTMKDGRVDYESPYRIDIGKLNEHMMMISNGEEITKPRFDFASQTVTDGEKYRREKGEVVIIEGIHALNPLVTGAADDYASCMYVSVRARIKLADGSLLHPSHVRLMRRLIRDKNFRGRSVPETLDLYDNVEAGENAYIIPFKHRAVYSVDTFLPYEPCIYKPYIFEPLEECEKSYPNFDERFLPMLTALIELPAIQDKNVRNDSLIREFIGGSKYEY